MIQAAGRAASPEEVRAALTRALEQTGLVDPGGGEPGLLDRFLRWLASLLSLEGAGETPLLALSLALAGVLAFLLAWRGFAAIAARSSARPDGGDAHAPHQVDAAELLERARRAEAAGEFLLALRLHFLALLAALGGRGLLRVRDSWTNRELLERGAPPAHLRAALEPLVAELDLRVFGGRDPRPEDVRRFAARCRDLAGEAG